MSLWDNSTHSSLPIAFANEPLFDYHKHKREASSFLKREEGELNMQTEQETALGAYAHLMLEHVSLGMALFEAREQRLLAANPCYQAFLEPQWQHGQAIGHTLTEFVPYAEDEKIAELFHRVMETGVSNRIEEYAYSTGADGMRYWNWTLDPICEQGQVCYVLLTLTEVTSQVVARQVAEETHAVQMQTHQQRLQHIETILLSVNSVSEPAVFAQALLHALDACFSPQVLALYDAHPEHETLSLLASQTDDSLQQEAPLFPTLIAYSHGSSPLVEAMKAHAPLIKKKSLDRERSQDRETESLLALPDVQCVVYLPLWGKRCEGVLVAAFTTEENVTDLLMPIFEECTPHLAEALAEARLRAAIADERQGLHTVLDQLPEGIVLVEARTGKVRYANSVAAHLLGYALPHLVGVPLNQSALRSPYGLSSQHQQSAFHWNFALVDALWGKTVTNQEIVVPRPDGSEIVVLSSAAPIRTSRGLITEAVMVFQDITPMKQLEQQKNEFFAVANHELRTPLTSILGFAELLQIHSAEDASTMQQYAISSIVQECDHLRRLMHELLDVSRLEHALLDLERGYHDLLAPLTQIVTKHRQITSTHRLDFTVEDLESTERLMGWFDLMRIEQMVNNLLGNAVKYSPPGSKIELGGSPRRSAQGIAQEVVIWVKDQGIGITARDLPHIFERFYRASTFGRSSISGFGIGLYLTKELVQAHGGRIWVESTKDQGSTFFVALPLGEPA